MSRRAAPLLPTRLQVLERLTGEHRQPLVILDWWRQAIRALDDPAVRELILWLVRQAGKSQLMAGLAISELLARPDSYTVLVAAGEQQAHAIYHRKVRKPLERLLKAMGMARDAVALTKRGIEVPALGSALEVVATTEETTPGRSTTLLVIDEARAVPDEVYAALAPSCIGAGGKVIVASTAGPPRGFFYQLTQNPTAGSWMYHSTANDNPHANLGVVEFLKRRLGLLSPAAAARELGNEFAEDGDELLPAALIAEAVDDRLGEVPASSLPAFAFLDLSRKRDLTTRLVVVRAPARRPEAGDHLVVASIRVWDPRRSPTGETPFEEVRADLAALPARFAGLQRILVDEGAEAGSVLPWAKTQPVLALRIEGFTATAASNMDLWGALAARLHARTLSIPRHERLLAELRSLRQESFAFGAKWRVVDASRKLHRDVSLALAGACFAAGEGIDWAAITAYMQDDLARAQAAADPVTKAIRLQETLDAMETRGRLWRAMRDY